MQRYNDFVIDQYGTPVVSATITVFATGTSTPATLYADDSLTPLANPTTTDGLGKYYFYAADGRYDIQISGANFTTQTITDVLLEDPQDGSTAVFSGVTITSLTGILVGNGASPVGLAAAGTADQILPAQTGHAGKILTTDGTNSSWTSTGAGSVFSVDVSGGTTGLTTSGGPITGSGTITLAGTLNSGNGGTGATIYAPGQLLIGNNAGGLTKAALTAGTGVSVTNGDGNVSVALSTPVSEANGGTGETTYTDGQLLIGNTAGGLTKATLTAGSGVSITNGDGSITVAVLGAGTGDVVGPASSVDGELALFNGATGKLLKSATTTGILKATSGVLGTAAASDITGQLITGFVSGAGTVAATDTVLQAINKLDGNVGAKADVAGSTGQAFAVSQLEIGHASDTTLTRVSAGVAAIEGSNILLASGLGSITQAYDANTAKTNATQTWSNVQTFGDSVRGTETSLTSSSASIAVDLAVGNFFTHTFTENTTLANPSNIVAGQEGIIVFTQHASSPKTLAFGTYYKFPGGTVPTITATNSAVDVMAYYVVSSTFIACKFLQDVK